MGLEIRENEKTPWKEGNRRKERSKDIIQIKIENYRTFLEQNSQEETEKNFPNCNSVNFKNLGSIFSVFPTFWSPEKYHKIISIQLYLQSPFEILNL